MPKDAHDRGLSKNASQSKENDGISMFEAKGNILKEMNDNVSFTVMFFSLDLHCIF